MNIKTYTLSKNNAVGKKVHDNCEGSSIFVIISVKNWPYVELKSEITGKVIEDHIIFYDEIR